MDLCRDSPPHTIVRSGDPETSKAAGAKTLSGKARKRVYEAVVAAGERGLTLKEYAKANGQTVGIDKIFKIKNTPDGGTDMMLYPHDPAGRIGQIVNCNCDFDTIIKRKKKKIDKKKWK